MKDKRKIEIFTAGCPLCEETVRQIRAAACPDCEIIIHDLHKKGDSEKKAREYGVKSVPAVAIDGKLAECCGGRGVDIEALKKAGLGRPL